MAGVLGMGYYSSPESNVAAVESSDDVNYTPVVLDDNDDTETASEAPNDEEDSAGISLNHRHAAAKGSDSMDAATTSTTTNSTSEPSTSQVDAEDEPNNDHDDDDDNDTTTMDQSGNNSDHDDHHPDYERIYGRKIKKRHLGIMAAAMFTGVWGGSILAPMKFCRDERVAGVGYLISFAFGASLVNILLWLIRWISNSLHYKSMRRGYEALPSFHIKVMWLPGGIGGILWAIGNFFSLISVYYLGEGVGYPLVQTSILVSGLWGIFYLKEIKGARRISMWLASACLAICGILLLSYQHHAQ